MGIMIQTREWQEQNNPGGNWYVSVDGDSVADATGYAGTRTKARDACKAKILDTLKERAAEERNSKKRLIVTNDRSIFFVHFKFGSWGYSITGPDRQTVGGTWGRGTFEETLERARKHAADGFAGIAYEAPL